MDVPVCQICKDPVWSFICPECLGKDIGGWLPKDLSANFSKFHRFLVDSFSPKTYKPIFVPCIKCKRKTVATICPFCYIAEAFQWLKNENLDLAMKLVKFLPLARDWEISETGGCVWKTGFRPVTEMSCERTQFGICDDCGEYSEELVLENRKWMCRDCAKE
ncbi:MAG: hypothetical protein KAU24_03945 [Candidatus Aenigmarchaeota archaeon]|nr:hypothetical protein [Candidatus Aenigmarchaeota archaeon]